MAANKEVNEERVEIMVPRAPAKDDPNLFVSINGVNYLLPRGKTSKVPKSVADEIYRSQRAQQRQDENREELLKVPE